VGWFIKTGRLGKSFDVDILNSELQASRRNIEKDLEPSKEIRVYVPVRYYAQRVQYKAPT